MLFAMIRGPSDGVMVPIPQYPLYSASIALYGGELVPYYLDEQNGWGLDMNELNRALNAARAKGNNMCICYRDDGGGDDDCIEMEMINTILIIYLSIRKLHLS